MYFMFKNSCLSNREEGCLERGGEERMEGFIKKPEEAFGVMDMFTLHCGERFSGVDTF